MFKVGWMNGLQGERPVDGNMEINGYMGGEMGRYMEGLCMKLAWIP